MEIQREHKTTMLFISHDLSIVRYLSDRVMVMYLGHVVEQGPTDAVFAPPYHPYTEALLSAVPIADTSIVKKRIVLEGDIPSAMNPPSGCPFQTRCRWKSRVPGNLCETEVPGMQEVAPNNWIKCHLSKDVLAEMEPVISQRSNQATSAPSGKPKVTQKKLSKKPAKKGSGTAAAALASVGATAAVVKTVRKNAKTATSATPAKAPAAKGKTSVKSVSPKSAVKKDARPVPMKKPKAPDDLKLISGVGPKLEGVLNGLGIYTFSQIAKWKKSEREWVDDHLNFKGRIDRDDWINQAKALAKGGVAEYIKVFGKKPR
jgi:peptide/nickel transport system ATP-binding protein